MYNAVFEADNGKRYVFGEDGNTVFDMNIGDGVSVDIGTSQGFLQIGETVENFTVTGRPIEVKGVVYGDVATKRKEMRGVFSPFVSGKLTIQDKYYIRVYVKDTPSFSPVKGDGRFTMVLFAPYPYFSYVDKSIRMIGDIRPAFSFPVNYSLPHKFGEKGDARYINVINDGDVNAPFVANIRSSGLSENVTLTNLETNKFLSLNGTLNSGDVVDVYRDERNVLRATLKRDGEEIDVLSWIDEASSLFDLNVGTNLIAASDDQNGANLTVTLSFNPSVVAVYED